MRVFIIKAEQFEDDEDGTFIRIWGKTGDGSDAYIVITDFKPYLYVRGHHKYFPDEVEKFIVKTEFLRKKDYNTNVEIPVTKVYLKTTRMFRRVKERLIENGYDVYESEIPFEERFLIDAELTFFDWVEVNSRKVYQRGNFKVIYARLSDVSNLPEEESAKLGVPRLKFVFFDIEVYNRETMQVGKAPIIAIGVYATDYNGYDKYISFDQIRYKDEKTLLTAFANFLRKFDPDFIIGYNSNS